MTYVYSFHFRLPFVEPNRFRCVLVYIYIVLFNSKTLFKDGDPVNLKLIFPGAIQT